MKHAISINMRLLVFLIGILTIQHSTLANNGNTLTQKLSGWVQQQKNHYSLQLAQHEAQKNQLESHIKRTEEQLNLLNASHSSVETRLPLIKKLKVYEQQLSTIQHKITEQKANLNTIDFNAFTQSGDFQYWINHLNGLTILEKTAITNEIAQVDELQQALHTIENGLADNNLKWEEYLQQSFDASKLGTEYSSIQESTSKILALQSQIKNIELNEVLDIQSFNKLTQLVTQKANSSLATEITKTTKTAIDLEKRLDQIKEEATSFQSKHKYKIQEIDHEDIKEVVFKQKPQLKNILFFETDLAILRSSKTLVNISPLLGMQLSKRFAWGLGTSYQNAEGLNQELAGLWSGRLMTRVAIWKDILSVQLEGLSTIPSLSSFELHQNRWTFSQLIGTRFSMPEGSKIPFNMTLLHNLNSEVVSPAYAAPWQMKLGILF